MKPDQKRVSALLIQTVSLLCKNGLHFDKSLHIQGLLGITIDEKDVFIVQLDDTLFQKPTITNPTTPTASSSSTSSAFVATASSHSSSTAPEISNKKTNLKKRRNSSNSEGNADDDHRDTTNKNDIGDEDIQKNTNNTKPLVVNNLVTELNHGTDASTCGNVGNNINATADNSYNSNNDNSNANNFNESSTFFDYENIDKKDLQNESFDNMIYEGLNNNNNNNGYNNTISLENKPNDADDNKKLSFTNHRDQSEIDDKIKNDENEDEIIFIKSELPPEEQETLEQQNQSLALCDFNNSNNNVIQPENSNILYNSNPTRNKFNNNLRKKNNFQGIENENNSFPIPAYHGDPLANLENSILSPTSAIFGNFHQRHLSLGQEMIKESWTYTKYKQTTNNGHSSELRKQHHTPENTNNSNNNNLLSLPFHHHNDNNNKSTFLPIYNSASTESLQNLDQSLLGGTRRRSNMKTVVCQYPDCGKTFCHSCHLYRHQRLKHGRRFGVVTQTSFHCQFVGCGKVFYRRASLINHNFNVHNIGPPPNNSNNNNRHRQSSIGHFSTLAADDPNDAAILGGADDDVLMEYNSDVGGVVDDDDIDSDGNDHDDSNNNNKDIFHSNMIR